MTRINANISPINLCDEHLLAEHREIKRICNRFKVRLDKNKFDDIPECFTLGQGHELFFVNKPTFTYSRYLSIKDECNNRGFKVTDFSNSWDIYWNNLQLKITLWSDYINNDNDNQIIIERISERLNSMKHIHYYGKSIDNKNAIDILKL
jgi:hypothetical protein